MKNTLFTPTMVFKSLVLLNFCTISAASFAQTNTLPTTGNVGIGTTTPSERLTVNGSARIDSALVVKDSVRINKNLRVDQDVRFLGETKMKDVKVTDEFVVNGLSKLNGDIKFPNVPLATNYSELNFLIMNQNGMLKKGSGDEFVNALKILMYSAPNPITPINICLDNPYTPTWGNGINKLFVECPDVKVGIGTINPSHQLTVTKTSKFGEHMWVDKTLSIGADLQGIGKVYLSNKDKVAAIHVNTTGNNEAYQRLLFLEYDNPNTKILEVINTATNRIPFSLKSDGAMDIDNGIGNIFHLGTNGMLSIGTGTTETFRVEADGLTRARKIKVDTQVWPDYVFEENYQLMPLEELEAFLLKSKHLPKVPSQDEMVKNGIDVAEMNIVLMEKVEELTLYLIQQNKEIEQLKTDVERLKIQKP
ncbi:hypothetical protein [Fluviicola taffensis]|uniref:Uncharacterized protein n=1 Tax=Fluviicola taffensis (strain DSM 16823 / NCIMB 13979 / RW262) TaxID=755732 RepID=F2IIC1_FLUTR|nr:hypothetical protein [Fluviicola taffensis]AEA43830.1 hypothetical protein Fluta_1843 [Fluviicola taffensis DSM 16823]